MTYEDVLKQYKLWYERGFNHYDMPSSEALVMMGKACEKQIPKKPIQKYKHIEEYMFCPDCSEYISNRYAGYKPLFCKKCGQRIDWSEVEE